MLNAHFPCKVMGNVVFVCCTRTTVGLNLNFGGRHSLYSVNEQLKLIRLHEGCPHIKTAVKMVEYVSRIFKKLVGEEITETISLLSVCGGRFGVVYLVDY